MASEQKLKELKRRYSLQLLNQKGVCGVGVEKDEAGKAVLAIHLDNSSADDLDLPKEFEDYPVRYVRQDGGFRKFGAKAKKPMEK